MADTVLEIKGLDQVNRELQALALRFQGEIGPALFAEAEIEMTEAKQRTPVRFGVLKGSGHVQGPEGSGLDTQVRLVFGGPAAGYAIYVHEQVDTFHENGRSKFLESTLLESAPFFATRVANRLQLS